MRTLRARLGEIWHVLAIVYVVAIYGVWALGIEGGFRFLMRATVLTVVVVALARFGAIGLRRLMDRLFRLGDEMRVRFPQLEQRGQPLPPGPRPGVTRPRLRAGRDRSARGLGA